MVANLSEVVNALEKQKCSYHKYRPMVFERNGQIEIVGCCKSFEKFLEAKSREMMSTGVYEVSKMESPGFVYFK